MSDLKLKGLEDIFIKEYIKSDYPLFKEFFGMFMSFLDEISVTDLSTRDDELSYYGITKEFMNFIHADTMPLQDKKLLDAFMNSNAYGMDFRNVVLDADNIEDFRNMLKDRFKLLNQKGTNKAIINFFKLIRSFKIGTTTKTFEIFMFFGKYDDTILPPDYDTLTEGQIVLTDLPIYYVDSAGEIQRRALADVDKGSRTYEMQLIAKDLDLYSASLFNFINRYFVPTGYFMYQFIKIENNDINNYTDGIQFNKMECNTGFIPEFKGEIGYNYDFPALPIDGNMYRIILDVTDDDGTKTNTGLSFVAGEVIYWDSDLNTWIS